MFKTLKTHLTIFQQLGYEPLRFLVWWFAHPATFAVSNKKPLVMTIKAKTLVYLCTAIFLLATSWFFILRLYALLLLVSVLFLFCPFIFLFLAWLLLIPYEKLNRVLTVNRTRKIIQNSRHLTTIGVTGSFGKTSVKDFLYTILSGWQKTIKTPESYNTVFGISRVVDLELTSLTRIFVCEMGAYVRGEIAELCQMVPPQFAILTAIGSQHLERFKTQANTVLAKFELIDSVEPSRALVNLDNQLIQEKLADSQYRDLATYSLIHPQADFFVSRYQMSPQGAHFTLKHLGKSHTFHSPLFGTSHLYNLTAAISMSLMLGVPVAVIKKQLRYLKPSPHRLEIKKINQAVLIDNAFSSNEEGFVSVLNDLKSLRGRKVLITSGIIELGSATASIHQKLGRLASDIFDQIIFVGTTEMTTNFEKGLSRKNKIQVSYLKNSTNLWPIIEELSQKADWILLENDLPDSF